MNSVFFVVLRRLRAPLILLILIYAVSVLGLALIPGVDAQGQPWRMSLFHAFYVLSYTATTIGFGEIPYAFTNAQRLWITFCIYLSVIGWAYAIGALLALVQDRGLRQALVTQRFERRVRRLAEPFLLVCGYGETGALLCRALDRLDRRFVVIDVDEARIQELELQDLRADAPALTADAGLPANLLLAGLRQPRCQGVIALTNDDRANLAIAITVRLLRPALPVLCRAMSPATAANMASFGTDYIINPFATFGDYLALAIAAPGIYQLLQWLTGVPGTTLQAVTRPPRGPWVVCGYGQFGREVVGQLEDASLPVTIIEPDGAAEPERRVVRGLGTEADTLRQAGITQAAGIVAGTDDDVNNLSIVMTARQLQPDLFVVLRQNLQANQPLFETFQADLNMTASDIIAHECLALLTTPLLSHFLKRIRQQDDAWAVALIGQLRQTLGNEVPLLWSVDLTVAAAPALYRLLAGEVVELTLDCLLRSASDRDQQLACVPLLLVRPGGELVLPAVETVLQADDRLLFAGDREAQDLQALVLRNVNARDYVWQGKDIPGGWVWQWLAGRRAVE